MVNRTSDASHNHERKLNLQQKLSWHKELPWGDDIVLTANGTWKYAKTRLFSDYLLQTAESLERQNRRRYGLDRGYDFGAGVSYSFHFLNKWHLTLSDNYQQQRNDINRWGGNVGLRYNTPNNHFGFNYKSAIDVRNLQSTNFSGDDITDWSNKLQLTASLPWQIALNASCNLVSRFGYSASSFNKTMALTDAFISKSLLGNNLTFELRASDIFHQNSKVRIQLNEQGRYETSVRKYLPSYVMVSIRYQFTSAKN